MGHERKRYYLREKKCHIFQERFVLNDFRAFFNQKVLKLLKLRGYKIAEQQELALQIVYSLVLAGLPRHVVSDSRDSGVPRVRKRVKIWDAVIDAGLAIKCLGSQESGCNSRYRASTKLLDLQEKWEIRSLVDTTKMPKVEVDDDFTDGLIVLRAGKVNVLTGKTLPKEDRKKPVSLLEHIRATAQRGENWEPHPQAVKNGIDHYSGIADLIHKINESNQQFRWNARRTNRKTGRTTTFGVDTRLRRISSGNLHRAARLYTFEELGAQSLRKSLRKTITIDGEQTAALDFSCMAVRMLYHFKRENPEGDLYRPELIFPKFYSFRNASRKNKAIIRDFVKRLTNVCLNVSNRKRANSAAGNLLTKHPKSELLKKFLNAEGVGPVEVIDRIVKVHPTITDQFFCERGIELMTVDSEIMLRILLAFTDAGKPALGIHDAVVCRVSDVEFAAEVMTSAYRETLRFDPVIKRSF